MKETKMSSAPDPKPDDNPDSKGDLNTATFSVKRMAYMAIFIALSAVGAMIKIPSPVGTIGLDSAPGYFCGLAFGYVEGICVIFMGHLITAGIIGFPLGFPLHLFIGLQLAVWVMAFRWTSRKSSSSTWRYRLRSVGTVKCAEPSSSTGTIPCSTFRPSTGPRLTSDVCRLYRPRRSQNRRHAHGRGTCSMTRTYLIVPRATPVSPS